MAEVIGYLREDATYGEKETLKWLRNSLPKEYIVFVEPPIRKKREIRYPDFILLTNYGYVVFEVKDWVSLVKATAHEAVIRASDGKERYERNPVTQAREYALALHQCISETAGAAGSPNIPYSWVAVLINLPASTLSRCRQAWGEDFILGREDLKNPDILLNRLKNLFPAERLRPLTREEIDLVRRVVDPVVEFETPDRGTIILDEQQERIVTEAPREVPTRPRPEPTERAVQTSFLTPTEPAEELPAEGRRLSQNFAIRLVRGYAGSGKTLVLIQRARYLRAMHPDWKIAVLTFNKPLQERLQSELRGQQIDVYTFHSLCYRLLGYPSEPKDEWLEKWLEAQRTQNPAILKLGEGFLRTEINWLRDMGITRLEDYLSIERHGVGATQRLLQDQRREVFEIYRAYRAYLRQQGQLDFGEMALQLLEGLENGSFNDPPRYHALLVDEAQDWAPAWVRLITHLLDPEEGSLFLTDDPSQSIYRYFSWKEKGIHVVGRTRWLRIPYRNTWEIYQAAYQLIADVPEIQQQLTEQGEAVLPEVSAAQMRHGPRPLLRQFSNSRAEMDFLREQIEVLRHEGLRDEQIAVLVRNRHDVDPVRKALRNFNGLVDTLHRLKGLEMEAVFIPYLDKTFPKGEDDPAERRLIYMGMTRARTRLYLSGSGRLPRIYERLSQAGWLEAI